MIPAFQPGLPLMAAGLVPGNVGRLGVPVDWITAFGVVALAFMMVMYWFEHHDHRFILWFALGCALSRAYGFLAGAWPFGVVEALWCLVAVRRFFERRHVVPAPGR